MQDQQQLWGVLFCHGLAPTALSPLLRDAVCTLVHMATQRLFLLKARNETAYLQRVQGCRERLAEAQISLREPGQLLLQSQEWLALFNVQGMALLKNGIAYSTGQTPAEFELHEIGAWLSKHHKGNGVWCTQNIAGTSLSAACSPRDICGLLAVPLPVDVVPQNWLLLFRTAADLEEKQSPPWLPHELQAAQDIGTDLRVTILLKAISRLNDRLTKANRHLEEVASTDALTHVWNRYRIEQEIERSIELAAQLNRPSALLLLDVDFFKRINDTHGHEAGDAVLVTLAATITQTLRETDDLGRWGGEEFVILASGCNLTDGGALAERVRQAVAAADFGPVGQVTISVGVSQWQPGDNRKSLVERADKAMYGAKEEGRNRVKTEQAIFNSTDS